MPELDEIEKENILKYFKFIGITSLYATKEELKSPAISQSELWSQKPEAKKVVEEFRVRTTRANIQSSIAFLGTLVASNYGLNKWRKPKFPINRYTAVSFIPAAVVSMAYIISRTRLIGEDMKPDIMIVMSDPEIAAYAEEMMTQKKTKHETK